MVFAERGRRNQPVSVWEHREAVDDENRGRGGVIPPSARTEPGQRATQTRRKPLQSMAASARRNANTCEDYKSGECDALVCAGTASPPPSALIIIPRLTVRRQHIGARKARALSEARCLVDSPWQLRECSV